MESINPECESLRYLHYEGKQFQRRPLLSDLAERMIPLIGVGPYTQYILHHNRHVPSNGVTSAMGNNIGRVPYIFKSSHNFLIVTYIDFMKKTCFV